MFCIFNTETTVAYKERTSISIKEYETEGAARGALKRLVKSGKLQGRVEDYTVATREHLAKVEKRITRHNLMSGKPISVGVNTPLCCDSSSETYWSM